MATQFCQKCKQAHPGRVCDYNEKGECAETVVDVNEVAETGNEVSKDEEDELLVEELGTPAHARFPILFNHSAR